MTRTYWEEYESRISLLVQALVKASKACDVAAMAVLHEAVAGQAEQMASAAKASASLCREHVLARIMSGQPLS